MDERAIRDALEAEADVLVPTPVDLWPAVAARLEAQLRQGRRLGAIRRWTVTAVMALLAVTVMGSSVWVASPELRASAASSVRQLIGQVVAGISAGPGATTPVEFRPTPPFIVKQPDYLPAGFERVKVTYNPGAGPESGWQLPAVSEAVVRDETEPSLPTEVSRRQEAHLIIVYRAEDGREVQLFERAALPGEVLPAGEAATLNGQDATLQTDGQVLTLTWVDGSTWIELRGDLPRQELLKVAEGLVTTAMPSAGAVAPEIPVEIEERVIPVVSLAEAQRQVSFTIPQPRWLPDGLELKSAHVSPPNWAQTFYGRTNGGEGGFGIETTQGPREGGYVYSEAAKQQVTVNGRAAICVQGAWNEHQEWMDTADAGALEWSANGFTYHIGYSHLGLSCGDLIRIAKSLTGSDPVPDLAQRAPQRLQEATEPALQGQRIPLAPYGVRYSARPLLGEVPGQSYMGRIVFTFSAGGGHGFSFVPAGPSRDGQRKQELDSRDVLKRALALLQDPTTPVRWTPAWVEESMPSETPKSYVVVEVWDRQTVGAVDAASWADPNWLIQRATQVLRDFLSDR